jgi:hypothetical protein
LGYNKTEGFTESMTVAFRRAAAEPMPVNGYYASIALLLATGIAFWVYSARMEVMRAEDKELGKAFQEGKWEDSEWGYEEAK